MVYKADGFIGNQIADEVTKSDENNIEKSDEIQVCWRNNYCTRKQTWNIKQIEKSIIRM